MADQNFRVNPGLEVGIGGTILTALESGKVGIGTTLPNYSLHVVGVGSTALYVQGDTRITGILSIGQGTITIDGNTNTITATNIVTNNLTTDNNVGYATTGYVTNALVGYATEGYVNQRISNLIDGAPGALDTLNELAAALNDDANFSSTVTNSLSTKISGIGIQSAGVSIATTVKTLNFIGAGNTFNVSGDTVDISISGGGGGSIGIQSDGTRVALGVTDLNIAIGSTTSRNIVASGSTATVSVDLGDYYIFRKPSVGFATMKVLIAGSQGGIAYSDYVGGSVYTGLTTTNTDQFPWVAGIGMSIAANGHLIFTVP